MLSPLHTQGQAMLAHYFATYPAERSMLAALDAQLHDPADCFVRSNLRGHVTTSAAVLSPDLQKILLIHHVFLDKWLPPGGHYEGPGDFWDSARREVEEETGVVDMALHPWCLAHGIPFDIDTHAVPENPAKQEGPHWHHDVRYLAIAAAEVELSPQLAEVHAARWAPLAELYHTDDRRLMVLARKLQAALG